MNQWCPGRRAGRPETRPLSGDRGESTPSTWSWAGDTLSRADLLGRPRREARAEVDAPTLTGSSTGLASWLPSPVSLQQWSHRLGFRSASVLRMSRWVVVTVREGDRSY